MKHSILCAGAVFALSFGAGTAPGQSLFSYETGEPGLPYSGNSPAVYAVATSTTTGVTNGTTSLQVTGQFPAFGGPLSSSLTDSARVNLINGATAILVDMTVPNVAFGFGNIDLHFFQPDNADLLRKDQETGFSQTFATSSGQTITLTIPTTNLQAQPPGTKLLLDPALPWSYQIDLSYNTGAAGPLVFYFDNVRAFVPEPASLALPGAAALSLVRRRRRT